MAKPDPTTAKVGPGITNLHIRRVNAPCRHADCVQFLLDQGANPFLTDKVSSLSPLQQWHQVRVMLAALTGQLTTGPDR